MRFWQRDAERRAEHERRKAERKAKRAQRTGEMREQITAHGDARKQREIDAMKALVQPGEELDALVRTTGKLLMNDYVLVTSSRVIVGLNAGSAKSFPYGQIARLDTSDFGTRDVILSIAGGKQRVELSFSKDDEAERDRLRDAISNRLFASP